MESLLAQAAEVGSGAWPLVGSAVGGMALGGLLGFLVARHTPRALLGRRARRVSGISTDLLWDHPSIWSEAAEQAFDQARRRARREERSAGNDGEGAVCLLDFHEVLGDGSVLIPRERGTKTVPISQIVGSIAKPCWFTRSFRPRREEMRGRWKRAYSVAHGLRGYEPVELYQLGESFFVVDGHFRISVAAAMGSDSVVAHVLQWR